MKNVNVYCYFHHHLPKKIEYVGYEVTMDIVSHNDCTIWCKPYTRDIKVCIKASYVDDWYWNVTTGALEHMSGYSFYAQLEPNGLWRSITDTEELVEFLKEVGKYK